MCSADSLQSNAITATRSKSTSTRCKHTLQTHAANTCCKHTLQTHVANTRCKHMLQTHAANTRCKHMLQTHTASAHYRPHCKSLMLCASQTELSAENYGRLRKQGLETMARHRAPETLTRAHALAIAGITNHAQRHHAQRLHAQQLRASAMARPTRSPRPPGGRSSGGGRRLTRGQSPGGGRQEEV